MLPAICMQLVVLLAVATMAGSAADAQHIGTSVDASMLAGKGATTIQKVRPRIAHALQRKLDFTLRCSIMLTIR